MSPAAADRVAAGLVGHPVGLLHPFQPPRVPGFLQPLGRGLAFRRKCLEHRLHPSAGLPIDLAQRRRKVSQRIIGRIPFRPHVELDRQPCPLRGRHPVREQARIGFGQVMEEAATVHAATMNASRAMLKRCLGSRPRAWPPGRSRRENRTGGRPSPMTPQVIDVNVNVRQTAASATGGLAPCRPDPARQPPPFSPPRR